MSEFVIYYLVYEFFFFALLVFFLDIDFPAFVSPPTLEPALLFLSLIYKLA